MNWLAVNDVAPGEEVTLKTYHEGGDLELRRHLLGMGFVKGSKIKVERVAPLGDPIEVVLRGYNLSLRKAEATLILVERQVSADE